ncbi:phosphohistidine phosphatase SixA [Psychrobacter aestuarii]|uniref:Phosphoglycerate mutase family protein n=1 Tax=Psychrobacter aestuarii TaxID=556327 RepID=A0ABN0VXD9_9GAMM|nr:phosphohistidine phosphatase SixA [Psychrobacter aestuarii]
MKIILMRHGQAAHDAPTDSERPLTTFGEAQALETGEYLAAKYTPELLIVSPYLRAQQSAAKVSACFDALPSLTQDNITPEDDARAALNTLAQYDDNECMVVVCHMSIVAHIAGLLTGEYPESFELAEARVFETDFVMMGMATECDRFVPTQP